MWDSGSLCAIVAGTLECALQKLACLGEWGGETPGFQSFGSASSELCDLGQAWSLVEPLLGRMGMMLR